MLDEKIRLSLEAQLPAVMDFADVRNFLCVSQRTVYRLIQHGEIPAWKDEDGDWNFLRSDIIKYLDENSNA